MDIDLSLEGPSFTNADLLQLLDAVDELLMGWTVDLSLRHQLPAALEAHLQRAGQPLIQRPQQATS